MPLTKEKHHQLTRGRLQLFGIIVQLAHERKPITFKVLCKAMKISSPNGIVKHLATLKNSGLITFVPPSQHDPANSPH